MRLASVVFPRARMSEVAQTVAAPAEETPGSVHIARNVLALVTGQLITMVLGILFSALLGRRLGVGDFGLYFLINSFSAFALVVVDWGQQWFAVREVAKAPERVGDFLGTGLVLRTVGTLLVCVPAALVAWALGYEPRTTRFAVAFIALNLPFFLALNFGLVFRGRDRMGLDAAVSVTNRAVGLLLVVPALALGLGLGGVVVAQGLAGVAALALAFRLYRRLASGPLRFSLATSRELLRGGTALAALNLAVYVQPYIDAVLLSKLVPPDAMGFYGAAKTIMGMLLAPALILVTASFPRLSRAAKDIALLRTEFATALRPALWLGALAGVGTWLFADVAIAIVYGHRQFAPAGTILRVYGIGIFLIFVDMLVGMALTAVGRASAFAALKAVSVVVGVGLELLFIPYFQQRMGNGGVGVTLSSALSELILLVGGTLLMPRGSLGGVVFLDAGRAVACALLTFLLYQLLPPLPPWVSIPLCILVFTALSTGLGLLRRGDLVVLRALLRRRAVVADLPAAVP
jgi:O-antigen/teichoic acid export membrane protein